MRKIRTARERARAELTQEIKDEARRQLADSGASGLSLRAISRELGMVSSALYRYFPSRDDLLTALIVDAYDALGERLEAADAALSRESYRERWQAFCHAARDWARAHPNEYALVYGSPVPGYRAPEVTIGPASRVPAALLRIVLDAWDAGALPEGGPPPTRTLAAQAAVIAELAAPGVPAAPVARAGMAWAQVFGLISFELFGHFANTLDPADDFYAYAVDGAAVALGLP
ncbi:MAG: TetR/AcrR family transcriptional regulator [Mycobacteriaceae bacterium]|nr:TetR/AcrR family transcriptional regulator [Mycobacteriaceae bacterium]